MYVVHNTYPTLKPILLVFSPLKPRLVERPHRRTDFFFLHVAIRNSLRSNKCRKKKRDVCVESNLKRRGPTNINLSIHLHRSLHENVTD